MASPDSVFMDTVNASLYWSGLVAAGGGRRAWRPGG